MKINGNFLDGVIMQGQGLPDVSGPNPIQANLNDQTQQIITNGTGAGQILAWYGAVRYLAATPSTITNSGTPTGGTLTVTVNTGGNYIGTTLIPVSSLTSAGIAYNASTSAFETAIEALNPAWAGLLVVSGSPGAWVITPDKSLSPISFSVAASYTGGTSPTATLTTAQVADATTAPTFGSAATTGGSLTGGSTIYAVYSYKNANGDTNYSAEASYTVPAGTNTNTITLTAPALPANATGINVYVGSATAREAFVGTNSANTFVITALAASGAKAPPQSNGTIFTSETINLSSLTDAVGASLTLKGVSCLHVENPSLTNSMDLFGGASTFAGPLSIASTSLKVPPAITSPNLQGQPITVSTVVHLPAYTAGGHWKVIAGVNDQMVVATRDPKGVAYVIILPGVR